MANHRTPLYRWHVEHQARMVPFSGWDMPVQYTGIAAEHHAVRTAVGIFDISHMARVNVHGPEALALLEKVFTNAVATMTVGQVRYGLICNENGGVLDDILVYRWSDSFSAVINASNREKILAWWEQHRTGEVIIDDRTFDTTMVAIQGPQAADMVSAIFGESVRTLKYYHAKPIRYREGDGFISRTGYTGEDGFEVVVPHAVGQPLWEEVVTRGAVPCGLGARDTLRLEAGMPLYGHELKESINPIQAGLGWAVKFDKGPFIGREALLAATTDTTQPRRIGLELDSPRAAREGCPIVAAGDNIGTVTSGSLSPWLKKSLAMGYVRPAFTSPGTLLAVDVRGALLHAKVVPLPFYRRTKNV
ncbi:MAG: glycine cleavage system aminomethyltransferase GcvT [Gemmataceae bacterium]|nr:glycine cleavage system aminomethyltransferase GcvT [Gemmata sp.]MDW8196505.1 glycine cleavage system aminomethyltransferase GcvT [Gemmataceae bacterium]